MTMPTEPPERIWTKQSIDRLADRFKLANEPGMQDWAYEVADPNRIEEFCRALNEFRGDPDTQFTLVDIILQSFEESDVELNDNETWEALLHYLEQNAELHAYQIWYWSSFNSELSDAWRISPFLRAIWKRVHLQNVGSNS